MVSEVCVNSLLSYCSWVWWRSRCWDRCPFDVSYAAPAVSNDEHDADVQLWCKAQQRLCPFVVWPTFVGSCTQAHQRWRRGCCAKGNSDAWYASCCSSVHSIRCSFVFIFRSTILSRPNKVGLKCPSLHPSVCMSIRPQNVSLILMKWYVGREVDEWCTMVCSRTRSKVKVTSPWKLEILPFSNAISFAICNGSWQLTTDSQSRAQCLSSIRLFFIFVLVFVSHDFELGRNVSCEESTVNPTLGCYACTHTHACM